MTRPRIVLVSGIPASGKSTCARWLADLKQCVHLDVDASGQVSLDAWLESLSQSGRGGVIDWGFPPSSLDTVRWLISRGVDPWWFDGDREAAQESFLDRHKRRAHPAGIEEFKHQIAQIEANWDKIEGVFRGRVIHSILPGPEYVAPELILAQMRL